MKNFISTCCTFLFILVTDAQEFPSSFIGKWKGELLWYKNDTSKPQKVSMQLIIQPTDSADQYTWKLIYGDKNTDNRPYLLKKVGLSKSHWVIDEKNGIILDQFIVGNKLIGAFKVQQNTIINSYWLEKKKLIVEFITVQSDTINTTGGKENIPIVQSYNIKGYQKAVLKKVKL